MRKRVRYTGIVLIIGAVVTLFFISIYAVSGRSNDGTLQGRALIWHAYGGEEAEALTEMIDRFRNIHPNVTVMAQGFADVDTLEEAYLNAVDSGLGPDVVIGPSGWIGTLAPAGQIAPVGAAAAEDVWQRYTAATLDTVRYEEDLYAIPLVFNTMALYYNRNVISTTVSTTDGLEREAAQSAMVLMSTTFRDAVWGINAFGGQLFDENGRVVLDRGGFANWLAWLANLRNYPGVILDNNRDALRNRFLQGDAAYYLGYASELSAIVEGLGLENIGVSPLPAGPIANAQPFLEVTAFMFSPVSSNNQRKIGLELAQFLSNAEQSGALMRRVRAVPANQRVRINPRLNPIVSSFAAQARAAAPLLNTPEMETVLRLGNEAYLRVLDGGVPPAEAAVAITNQINEANSYEMVAQPEYTCTHLGTVRLLHTWEDEAAEALEELIRRFRDVCPLIIVDAEYETPQSIATRLGSTAPGIGRAFTVLGSPELLQVLMRGEEPLIKNLTPYIPNELLQRFHPNAVDTMRYQRVLYGLPLYLEVDTVYYNRDLINTPALAVDDLRTQAGQTIPIALDVNFERAYWGVSAFGGRLFDAENRLLLDRGGMAAWLAWLYESRESFGINLSMDSEALRNRFEMGQTAYYVGSSADLGALVNRLGEERLGVAEPPDGPGGNSVPLLSSQGFFLSQTGSDTQVALALEFIQFATNSQSQLYLAEAGGFIPVNATVELPDESYMDTFMNVARTALAPPNTVHMQTLRARGDAYYRRVLDQGDDPETVVTELTTAINEEHGIAPLPTPEPTTPPAPPPVEEEDTDTDDMMLEGDDPDDPPETEGTPAVEPPTGGNE